MTDYKFVCAIDIGSLYTGYAYNDRQDDVILNKEWGANLGLNSYKTATSVLTNEDGTFEEFGYDAEYKYSRLCGLGDAGNRQLYQTFMMQVAGLKTINRQTMVQSTTGTERPLVELLLMTLEYIKSQLKRDSPRGSYTDDSSVHWIIPVPSCWDDSTQSLILELACQAGMIKDINSNQLQCVPASKMAAYQCRLLDQEKFEGNPQLKGISFNVGTRFMIIDAGGSVKVSTHEVQPNGDITEVDLPMAEYYGGQKINQQFDLILQRVLGGDFIKIYKEQNPDFWFQQDVLFEKKKRAFQSRDNEDIRLPISSKLAKEHKNITGDDIQDIIQKFTQMGLSTDNGELVVNMKTMEEFYGETFDALTPKIEALLKSPNLKGLKHLFVVGGVAESDVFRKMLSSQFPKYSVITPMNSSTAVLCGAVAYGQCPNHIPIRKSQDSASKDFRLVCAIDFGTTYTGYAYSDSGHIDSIIMNKEWENPLGIGGYKTATSVLTNPQGELEAFGFNAEFKYSKLCADDDADGLNLYRHFKMLLHNEKDLTRDTIVTSITGTKRLASDLFRMSLAFLKEHFFEAVYEKEGRYPDMNEIRWVITIPAIWSDRAKQFMREAAFKAGLISDISSKKLLFALEPEAAALYCQDLQMDKFFGTDQALDTGVNFKQGSKYMVIDAGGGTVDISVQQVLQNRNIKQLLAPSGGDWGGNMINSQFEGLMKTMFGKEFIETYKKEYPDDWLELESSFEKQKRAHRADGISKISLSITTSFSNCHEENTRMKVKDVVEKFEGDGISVKKFRLVMNATKTLELYHTVTMSIIPYVDKLLQTEELKDLHHIFLVGGFAESEFLKKSIGTAFFKLVVLTPENSASAVMRGAVIFGHNPERISSRVIRKTYGCSLNVPFNKNEHDPDRKVTDEDGILYCKGVFDKYITKGDEVRIGDCKTFISYPFSSTATAITKIIVSSDSKENKYANEEGVTKEAVLKLPMLDTKGGKERKIETQVFFGDTEIKVESRDARPGGKAVRATLDFFGNLNY